MIVPYKKLKDAFDFIDIDKNGIISREELVNAYLQLYNDENLAIKEANRVMMRIDINQNGSIDYNEFLMANLAVQGILTPERLTLSRASLKVTKTDFSN